MKPLKQSTAPSRTSRAKKAAKKDTQPQPTAPSDSAKEVTTNPTYIFVNPSPQPTPALAFDSTAPAAGLSVPPLAPPAAAVSPPNRYASTSYVASTGPTPYPAYPSPPPPPPPFSPSPSFVMASSYSSTPGTYGHVLSSYISTSAVYSTSTTTPYGSRGYLPPSPPVVPGSHYPFAHYHPAQSPRTETPPKQAPVVPKYIPTVATVMQCIVCGATDVPLYLGGRTCPFIVFLSVQSTLTYICSRRVL